jgi:hypothetical protein
VPALEPRALVVDVVGTCVDWRGSIIAERPSVRDLAKQLGV